MEVEKIVDQIYLFNHKANNSKEVVSAFIQGYCRLRGLPDLSHLLRDDFARHFEKDVECKIVRLSDIDDFFKRNFSKILQTIKPKYQHGKPSLDFE